MASIRGVVKVAGALVKKYKPTLGSIKKLIKAKRYGEALKAPKTILKALGGTREGKVLAKLGKKGVIAAGVGAGTVAAVKKCPTGYSFSRKTSSCKKR